MSEREESEEMEDEQEEADDPSSPPERPPHEHAWLDTWWGKLLALLVGGFNWWALIHYTM